MQITHKPRHQLEQEIKDLKAEQCVGFYECVCYVLDKNEEKKRREGNG